MSLLRSNQININTNKSQFVFSNNILKYSKLLNKIQIDKNNNKITIEQLNDILDSDITLLLTNYLTDIDKNIEITFDFTKYNCEKFINLIIVLEYLKINLLKNKFINYFNNIIESSKSIEHLREKLNITSDFSAKEESEIKNENWNIEMSKIDIPNDDFGAFSTIFDHNKKKPIVNDILIHVKKRKLNKPADDQSVIGCSKCKMEFDTFNRKHHCRKCGRIYCYNCCNKFIIIPDDDKLLLNNLSQTIKSMYFKYINTSEEIEKDRVCNDCYNEILSQNSYYNYVKFLNIIAPNIINVKKIGTINKNWRKASINYLSIYRELQYKLPSYKFNKYEKKILWNNRENFKGHSVWLIQLIRSINYKKQEKIDTILNILKNNKKTINCFNCMCNSLCNNKIKFNEALIFFTKNINNQLIRDYGVECLNDSSDEEISTLLPALIHYIRYDTIENSKLKNFLFTRAAKNQKLCNDIYWLLSVNSESKDFKFRYDLLKQELTIDIMQSTVKENNIITDLLNGVKFIETLNQTNDVDIIKRELIKIKNPFPSPINSLIKISKIDINNIRKKESATAPLIIPFYDNNDKFNQLMFKKEDIRKDYIILNIINLANILLKQDDEYINIPFLTYRAIPTSSHDGFIEIVENANTISDILNKRTINNHLQKYSEEMKVKELKKNYTDSLAFWTVITHLLGIGDRHLDNIMLTHNGILFHIDYGYILGDDSKPFTPNIRINNQIIEAIGGEETFNQFKCLCSNIFVRLRKHYITIYNLLSILIESDPKIQTFDEKYLENHIDSRFFLGYNEDDAKKSFELLIENCKNNIGHQISDFVHEYKKTSPIDINNIVGNVSKKVSGSFKWLFGQ